MAATVSTKGAEARFLRDLIAETGAEPVIIDLSTKVGWASEFDVSSETIADYHSGGRSAVFLADKGAAIEAMAEAFRNYVLSRTDLGALLGIGGSCGTALITPAMRALPIGIPKLMISTMASGDVSAYVGDSDIAMMHSVTDVAGINQISRQVLANGAHAIAGAVLFARKTPESQRSALGLTMFGVTTECVDAVVGALHDRFDCLVFHATGSGGRAMERLAEERRLEGVIDLTTTEVCDYLFGGVLACSDARFDALARSGLPYVGSCGALDMVNFRRADSVPERYSGRLLHKHNPEVTLMRTSADENRETGEWIGKKLNRFEGPLHFLIPNGGVSALDAPGQPFWDPEADEALFTALEETVIETPSRKVKRLPTHINDPRFAASVVDSFLTLYPA